MIFSRNSDSVSTSPTSPSKQRKPRLSFVVNKFKMPIIGASYHAINSVPSWPCKPEDVTSKQGGSCEPLVGAGPPESQKGTGGSALRNVRYGFSATCYTTNSNLVSLRVHPVSNLQELLCQLFSFFIAHPRNTSSVHTQCPVPVRRSVLTALSPSGASPHLLTHLLTMSSTMRYSRPPQRDSWFAPLSVDLFLKVLNTTLLHPFIAWLIPLCFRAQTVKWEAPPMVISIAWAIFITLCWIASIINQRIAHGIPREVDLGEEVIVITGGSSGLGLLIAEVYGMRGASVAVLDVNEMENTEARGVTYYKCDVSDKAQVAKVADEIEKEVCHPYVRY